MAGLKTKPHNASVSAFLKSVEHETRRRDAQTINKMMTCITGEKPKMWGETIVGFGSYHYKYASGREGDWFLTGFSPRKTAMSPLHHAGLWPFRRHNGGLGKHKTGRACLYISKLDDVDLAVLEELITKSV